MIQVQCLQQMHAPHTPGSNTRLLGVETVDWTIEWVQFLMQVCLCVHVSDVFDFCQKECIIGANVYIAVTFLKKRQNDGNSDKISILLHAGNTRVACERVVMKNQNMKDFVEKSCFHLVDWGSNGFGEAIYQAEQIMKKNTNDRFILMFLTDGDWSDDYAKSDKKRTMTASQRVARLMKDYKSVSFYAIAFGDKSANSSTLKKMAKAGGDNPVKQSKIPESLGNYFVTVVESETDVALLNRW